MAFTTNQLATAIEEVSKQFFVSKDEDKITNKVLELLFKNLIADVRASKPLGTNFCEISKLARKIRGAAVESMGHIPERLAERLSGRPVHTAIDDTLVQFVFFGPRARDRSVSGTSGDDKRLYLEFRHQVLKPAITSEPEPGPHQLRRVPDNFTGRDDLLVEVLHRIQANGNATLGIRGLPGVGKTTFALAVAEHLSHDYRSQIFLDLKGNTSAPLTPVDVMTHVVHAYRPDQKLPGSFEELSGLYYTVLHAQRALLVLDNARDASQVQPVLPPKSCFLIITSRQLFTLPNLHAVDLTPLSPNDACDLLIKIVPRCADDAPRIAELCGFLPIALCAAGSALVQQRDVKPNEYAKRLGDTRTRLQLIDPLSDVSLEASISLSCSLLPRILRRRFEALSVFRGPFDRLFATIMWSVTRTEAHDTLGVLTKYSMIAYDDATDLYSLHDLVGAYAYSRLAKWRRFKLAVRHTYCFAGLAIATHHHYARGDAGPLRGLRLFQLAWPNIELAFERIERYIPGFLVSVLDKCRDSLALSRPPADRLRWLHAVEGRGRRAVQARLLADMADAYRDMGEPQRAAEYARRAVVLSTEAKDQHGKSVAENILLRAAVDLGNAEAEIESALARLKLARGSGRAEDIQDALHYLAARYVHAKLYREAIQCFQEQLSLTRECGQPKEVISALDSLAATYDRLDDFAGVIQCSEEEAKLAHEEGAWAYESNAYGRLALAYERQGDGTRAHISYGRRLGTIRDATGPIPADDIYMIGRESIAWAALGYPDRGRKLGQIALELASLLGHRQVESYALFVLALAHDKLGNDDEMKRCMTEAAEIAHSVGASLIEGAAKWALSAAAAQDGDIAAAISIGESALAVFEKFPARGLDGVRAHVNNLRERVGPSEEGPPQPVADSRLS